MRKNEKVMKRHYAKSYGEKNTPCRALKAMRQGGVPTDLRPSTGQLKHARRQLQLDGRVDGYSVECLGEVQEFISNPPADVRVLEGACHLLFGARDSAILPEEYG